METRHLDFQNFISLFTRFLTDTGIYTKKTYFSQVGANAQ